MKKLRIDYKIITFIGTISLLFCFSFFFQEMHVSYDSYFHMHRLVGLVDAFRDHQFLPKIYPYANNGYGYATPLFYCDLFLYPFAILYWLGIPLVVCYKLMVSFYTILSIISIFYVASKMFKNHLSTPYFLTIIYTFCNYRLYDVYERGALGEIISFVFIPLIIYAIYKIFFLKEDAWLLLGGSFALLLMSHNITFALGCLIFGLFVILYVILNRKNINELKRCAKTVFKAMGIALLLSAWYLLPMLEQMLDQEFVVENLASIYDLSETALPLSAIFSPFAMLDRLDIGRFAVINLGWPLVIMPLGYLFIKDKNSYVTIGFAVGYIVLAICGGVLGDLVKPLAFIQFLFRLYLVAMPIMVLISAYIYDNSNVKISKILITIVLMYSTFNSVLIQYECLQKDGNISNFETKETMYDFTGEKKYRDHNGLEISGGEYLPVTEKVDYLEDSTFIKEIRPDGYVDYIYDYNRDFTSIKFNAESDMRRLIMLPQTYYKGYQAYKIVDGKKQKIETINVPEYKQVGFYIDEGFGEYVCEYSGTFIQNISLIIGGVSLIGVICAIIKDSKNRKLI